MSKKKLPVVQPKGVALDLESEFFRALADPTRLSIVMRLAAHNGQDVDAIAATFPQDRSVISRHLGLLHDAGILQREQEGRHVFYRLDGRYVLERLEQLVSAMRAAMDACCPPEGSSPRASAERRHTLRKRP